MDIGIQDEIAGSNLKLNLSSEVNLRKEFSQKEMANFGFRIKPNVQVDVLYLKLKTRS